MEDMGEQLHAMVVIDSHELVVLLLIDLVTNGFAIDDSGHAIERIALRILLLFTLFITNWLNLDVINCDLSAMLALTEPSFVFVQLIKRLTIDMGNGSVFWLLLYGE